MERLMRRRNSNKGLKLIRDAVAEDSGAKYFLAILKYRYNPVDPKLVAARRPLTAGGRTTTCGGCATTSSRISTTLRGGTGLMTATMMTFRYCPSRIPTSAFGKRDVGAMGRIPKRSSTIVALSVASVMSLTSGRVASAPP
jgi:hypothetical protein